MSSSEPAGTLDVAMAHAARLLDVDPALAAEQAQEILKAVPDHPPAVLLLASARRRGGDPQVALALLEPLVRAQGKWAAAQFELGLALAGACRDADAIVTDYVPFNRDVLLGLERCRIISVAATG